MTETATATPTEDNGAFFTLSTEDASAEAAVPAAAANGHANGAANGNGADAQPKPFIAEYKHRDGRTDRFEVPPELLNTEGQIDPIRAAKRAVDLRAKLGERGIDPDAAAPAVPEAYTWTVPEDLAAEGVELSPDDPQLKAFEPVFKEIGLSQEQADKLVAASLQQTKAQREAEAEAVKADREADLALIEARFGSREAARQSINGQLGPWLKGTITGTPEEKAAKFALLNVLGETGAGALALYDLMQAAREPAMAGQTGASAPRQTLSEEQLRALMRQPGYHDPNHPDHRILHQQVTEGYKRLYAET